MFAALFSGLYPERQIRRLHIIHNSKAKLSKHGIQQTIRFTEVVFNSYNRILFDVSHTCNSFTVTSSSKNVILHTPWEMRRIGHWIQKVSRKCMYLNCFVHSFVVFGFRPHFNFFFFVDMSFAFAFVIVLNWIYFQRK